MLETPLVLLWHLSPLDATDLGSVCTYRCTNTIYNAKYMQWNSKCPANSSTSAWLHFTTVHITLQYSMWRARPMALCTWQDPGIPVTGRWQRGGLSVPSDTRPLLRGVLCPTQSSPIHKCPIVPFFPWALFLAYVSHLVPICVPFTYLCVFQSECAQWRAVVGWVKISKMSASLFGQGSPFPLQKRRLTLSVIK